LDGYGHQWPAIQANISTLAAVSDIIIICHILEPTMKEKNKMRVKMSRRPEYLKTFSRRLKSEKLTISKINSLSTGVKTLLSLCA